MTSMATETKGVPVDARSEGNTDPTLVTGVGDQLLRISGLRTYFYTKAGVVKAIDGIDLVAKKGEVLCIVGESGSGKSTVALSILRLLPKSGKTVSGQILYEGVDLLKLRDEEMRRRRGKDVSIIWQDPMSSLNPVFKIGDQIAEAIEQHTDMDSRQVQKEVVSLLQKVGIPDAENRAKVYPHELSGGMRQRVMIAMALSCSPKVLIADEPTTALDVTTEAQILDLMNHLRREYDSAIIMITHNMGIVAEMGDRVAVMYAGKVVEETDVASIFKKPLHPYTQALLHSIPRVDRPKEKLVAIPGTVPSLVNLPTGCSFNPRCPYAMDVCRTTEPDLVEIEPDHKARCHLLTKERGP
jgi:oligopeptide/dipeptide ABC transporter ATP-binding protein